MQVADPARLAAALGSAARAAWASAGPGGGGGGGGGSRGAGAGAAAGAWGGGAVALPTVYVATDAPPGAAGGLRSAVAGALALPEGRVVVFGDEQRLRSPHGSHTLAFTPAQAAASNLLLPYDVTLEVLAGYRRADQDSEAAEGGAVALRDQERVRLEALEDLWLLSAAAYHGGSASSHFSVLARLWAVGRRTADARAPAAYDDLGGVASGRLANGFMHGKMNGTRALLVPSQRMRRALQRLVEWPLPDDDGGDDGGDGGDAAAEAAAGLRTPRFPLPAEGLSLDPARGVPLVPYALLAGLARSWQGPHRADAHCSRCAVPAGCSGAALINDGAALQSGSHMNPALAAACWRRALMMPGEKIAHPCCFLCCPFHALVS